MFSLWDMLGYKSKPIKIIDVGALMIGNSPPDYQALLKPGASQLIGFEPNEQECKKLNQTYNGKFLFLPYFIGDGSKGNFNVCKYKASSSLYEPNINLLEKFQNMAPLHQVVEKSAVSTMRLDDIPEVQGADYLKIDVQGAECDVFNGAEKLLSDIMIIHTEVEFIPLYVDQPLFADVDQILRKNGFIFHRFYRNGMAGRAFKPLLVNNDVTMPIGQVLWADVVYIKNFMDFEKFSPEKLLKMAVILHDVYGSFDLAHYTLQHYDKQTKQQWSQKYLSQICQNKNISIKQ